MRTHKHTCTCTHAEIHIHTCADTHGHAYMCTFACTHIYIYTNTPSHTPSKELHAHVPTENLTVSMKLLLLESGLTQGTVALPEVYSIGELE